MELEREEGFVTSATIPTAKITMLERDGSANDRLDESFKYIVSLQASS